MANDIVNSISGVQINHGSLIVNIPPTGYQTLDTDTWHTPVIASIQSKYDTRFDDTNYYD